MNDKEVRRKEPGFKQVVARELPTDSPRPTVVDLVEEFARTKDGFPVSYLIVSDRIYLYSSGDNINHVLESLARAGVEGILQSSGKIREEQKGHISISSASKEGRKDAFEQFFLNNESLGLTG